MWSVTLRMWIRIYWPVHKQTVACLAKCNLVPYLACSTPCQSLFDSVSGQMSGNTIPVLKHFHRPLLQQTLSNTTKTTSHATKSQTAMHLPVNTFRRRCLDPTFVSQDYVLLKACPNQSKAHFQKPIRVFYIPCSSKQVFVSRVCRLKASHGENIFFTSQVGWLYASWASFPARRHETQISSIRECYIMLVMLNPPVQMKWS